MTSSSLFSLQFLATLQSSSVFSFADVASRTTPLPAVALALSFLTKLTSFLRMKNSKIKKCFQNNIAQICTIFEPPTHSSHLLHPSHWGSVLQYSHFLQMRSIKLFFFPSAWVASNTRAMIEQQSNRDLFMLTALFFRCIPRTFSYECCRLSAVFHYRPLQDQTGPVTVTKLQHRPEYLRIFKQFTSEKFFESRISI